MRKRAATLGIASMESRLREVAMIATENPQAPELEELFVLLNYVLTLGVYDCSANVGFSLAWVLPLSIISVLGTEVHHEMLEKVTNGQIVCCLMMTELAHGTNVREFRTSATFDTASQQFVFNTPNMQAIKCWSGNLAGPANYAILFAQLHLAGQKRGIHPFLVQLRDCDNHQLLPGITVGDMGDKVGMHGIANGWASFSDFRQPRSALLNRFVDVSDQGDLVSMLPGVQEDVADSLSLVLLGAFSDGRVGLTAFGVGVLITAVTVALRFSNARKQFPVLEPRQDGVSELPVMHFQLQQCRLLPHLAAAHVWYYGVKVIQFNYLVFRFRLMDGGISLDDAPLIKEIHALSCAGKALSGWLGMQAVQEAREACGGHGYLHAARLGQLREDLDVNLTWEGDNNVLVLQTGAYLLGVYEKKVRESPLHSIDFIGQFDFSQFEHSARTSKASFANLFTITNLVNKSLDKYFLVQVMQYATCYRLWKYAKKVESLVASGLSKKEARLMTQAFYSKSVAINYIETFVLTCFYNYVYDRADKIHYGILRLRSLEYAEQLQQLFTLYACCAIEKRLGELFECGLANSQWNTVVQEAMIELSATLTPDCLALVDAIAPSDFVINSVLAHSDSDTMYQKVFDSLVASSSHMLDPKSLPFASKL